jgi:hypothetical protein
MRLCPTVAASTTDIPKLPPQIPTDIVGGIVIVAELDLVCELVKVPFWVRVQRSPYGLFRPAGNENAEREVVIEETMFDGG